MDGLRLLRGILSPPLSAVGLDVRANSHSPARRVAVGGEATAAAATSQQLPRQSHMFPRPIRKLWPGRDEEHGVIEEEEEEVAMDLPPTRGKGNWVMDILRVRSLWAEERETLVGGDGAAEEEGCRVDAEEEEEEERVVVDRELFSSLLRRVSLVDAELYAKMSYLSNLAYSIPRIKPANLLKYHGLHFVTSSLEKKSQSLSATEEQTAVKDHEQEKRTDDCEENVAQGENGNRFDASLAYEIAATAASYLQSQTKSILPFRSGNSEMGKDSPEGGSNLEGKCENAASDMASFVATTNSVTAVVAGKEEMKQAVAKDLNSLHSSPCEWFICDGGSSTRYFIIQGSESLASWQANLLFEPIQFEGLDVLVHRGIYEAAKGIYQQILPEIQAHLKSCGKSATLRFTGHSLGGSLSLLVNLMLLIRGDAPPSSLLPVITFGAPTIMCRGDYLLRKLGLPESHVQAITMHRDIVPRAFSCNYPDHMAKILATVNGNFRNHPCLENQKVLYAPMGKLLILQPEEKYSPHHHLLPSGSGLYILGHPLEDSKPMKLLQEAQQAFLNSPHPLEILSDHGAYGSDGTVYRDHDMRAYLRSLRAIIRQELKQIRKAKRDNRCLLWWPLILEQGVHSDVITGRRSELMNSTQHRLSFIGAFHGGKERLKRFGRMVFSQHIHLVILLLFPARLLLMGTVSW